jgi:hypothetical protein
MKTSYGHGWIPTLANRWALFELPAGSLTHANYCQALAWLYKATGDIDRTETIMHSVLLQAQAIAESSLWVVRELAFEAAVLDGGDRHQLARHHLAQGIVDDTALDLFNQRLTRSSQLPTWKAPDHPYLRTHWLP